LPNGTYELIALGARYWFVFLGAVIVWRSYSWLLSDSRARKRVLRNLPDAGTVGEIVDLDTGDAYPLPREGVLGSGHNCDIRLRGLRRRHAVFSFLDGRGVQLIPRHAGDILIDGQPVRKGGYATHGTRVEAGGYMLRVRLFAGLNVPRPAVYTADTAYQDVPQDTFDPRFAPEDDTWAAQIPDDGYLPPVFTPADSQPPADTQVTWQYAPVPADFVGFPHQEMPENWPDESDGIFPSVQPAKRRFGRRRRGQADG
jgi:hypothetical protein